MTEPVFLGPTGLPPTLPPCGPPPMTRVPEGFAARRVRMHGGGWTGWGHEVVHRCGWSVARQYASDARREALGHTTCPCWVLRRPTGEPWDDEHDAHFDTAAQAWARVREIVEDYGPTALTPVQLPGVCVVLRCAGCDEQPDDDEYGSIHFPDGITADEAAPLYGWRRVDGEWHCEDCALELDGEAREHPVQPGPLDVPLPFEVSRG